MTDAQHREAARQFYYKWNNKGKEDEDGRSFWIDLLQDVLGMDHVTDRVEFEKKVIGYDGNVKRIDAYIAETSILIEQKSLGIKLDKPQAGHGGKTPYEQAKEYADGLPFDEKPRWIVLSNFAEIWIYDMNTKKPYENITVIPIADLQTKYTMLSFLYKENVKKISEEMELSLKAGELVGKIHDRFLEQYHDPMAKKTQNSLNILCVRLVFCLYAEDAGLFGEKDAFKKYIEQYEPKDIRTALINLFEVLNTPGDERADLYLSDELDAFPYVNGGLFERKNIVIPKITDEIKDILIESSLFDWSKISPTIFGAVFESTLNPETRRKGGMHYTSIENIHKVIDPLFLDDLKAELERIKQMDAGNKAKQLRVFQDKLADLNFLDPACGSGNFLTETYLCIRRLENEVIRLLYKDQMSFGFDEGSPIKVSISHFHGIEINDFAVTVAKTALWIAESQTMEETKHIVFMPLDFLPIKTQANIVEGNALRLDWNHIIPNHECNYIMGNPPFLGYKMQSVQQKEDLRPMFGNSKNIDYVSGWYYKASEYIQNTNIEVSFVSTNSITQGEQVSAIWTVLFERFQIDIQFAFRTFIWDSEASSKAHVHCVVIGFGCRKTQKPKYIYIDNQKKTVKSINPYLTDAPNIIIMRRLKPLSNCEEMLTGSEARDGGFLLIDKKEIGDITLKNPDLKPYIKRYITGEDFINNKIRYCLWLKDASPMVLKNNTFLMERLAKCKEFREKSKQTQAHKMAEYPYLFVSERQPTTDYLLIPQASSENRRYIPIGYMEKDIIVSNTCFTISNASLYNFGIITSNVHMAWMRTVAGRLKSDYRYSNLIVYNNFPWPDPTDKQKSTIEQTAQGILDARNIYPEASLADLYDPLTMPPELRKAHQLNDKAVMQAYGMPIKETDEAACVAWLMKLYQEMVKEAK